ncbi:MAG: hypothetical protein DDT34_01927 [Firmicutes bacterium]|nr:hypothetical protein [Bacillota bacterium]MBT9165801.1 hypothetical protein [Chloroflexota bacterium]
MKIKRILQEGEPELLSRVIVRKEDHPLFFAKLQEIGIGRRRAEFVRDTLEAVLSGQVSSSAATSKVISNIDPRATPVIEEQIRRPPNTFFNSQDF